jgi:hypothetical protein
MGRVKGVKKEVLEREEMGLEGNEKDIKKEGGKRGEEKGGRLKIDAGGENGREEYEKGKGREGKGKV